MRQGRQIGKNEVLAQNPLLNGLLNGSLSKITKPNPVMADPTKPYTLYFDNNLMKELWLALTWRTKT